MSDQPDELGDYALKPSDGLVALEKDKPMILTPFPNGGWTIVQGGKDFGGIPLDVGAYSNATDMIDALSLALIDEVKP